MIQGKLFYQGNAAHCAATLYCEGEHFTLKTATGLLLCGRLDEVKVSDRLGNIERKLNLKDGSVFSTLDNAGIDALFVKNTTINGLIHKLESNIVAVLIAVALTFTTGIACFTWGIPWVSTQIAHALPYKTNELIAANTLNFLDKFFLRPSQLDAEEKARITARFKSALLPLEEKSQQIQYTLHFRQLGDENHGIPNAFALPSGDLILTDAFVKLSQSQDEIDSVLLHEMGHVVHRHSLQMVISSTLVATVAMLAIGDSNSLGDLGLGLGSLFVSGNYSRRHESEADTYAFEKMLEANINPQAFAEILTRISEHMGEHVDVSPGDNTKQKTIADYLSSHPSTTERVQQAKRYEKCFNKGWITCDIVEE